MSQHALRPFCHVIPAPYFHDFGNEARALKARERRRSAMWNALLAVYAVIVITGCALLFVAITGTAFKNIPSDAAPKAGGAFHQGLPRRSWGGFDERPLDGKCYRQERTAMILSFVLGSLGVDQWYAHHWPLAVFKMLAGLSTWGVTILGVVISRGEDGGRTIFRGFSTSIVSIWWAIDVILWMVGGVYGTPGCPGGNGWRY